MDFSLFKDAKIKFALLGAGKAMVEFSEMLKSNGFPMPFIVTYSDVHHVRDSQMLAGYKNYSSIVEYSLENNLEMLQVDQLDSYVINQLKEAGVNVVLSLKWRSIIKADFINAFSGAIFNVHHGDLPFEKGGSPASNRILNNIPNISVVLHRVSEKIDAGSILYKESVKIDADSVDVDEMNDRHIELTLCILGRLISDIENGCVVDEVVQEEQDGIYMPQLVTEVHGVINWDWSASEICRFIRAFGRPYPGAYTFHGKNKVSIMEAAIGASKVKFHPFYSGRVVNIGAAGELKVVAGGELLVVKKIKYNDKSVAPSKYIKLAHTLHSPHDMLMRAKTARISPMEVSNLKR